MKTPAVMKRILSSIQTSGHGPLVLKQLAVLVITFVIGFSGSAAMAALRTDQPVPTPSASRTLSAPAPGPEAPPVAPPPAAPAAVAAATSPAGKAPSRSVAKAKQTPTASAAAPVTAAPPPAAPAAKCSRLDDPKIDWLLQQVAKTKVEHPDVAVGASTIEQALLAARGKNLCAAEAQALVAQLCTDPEAVKALNRMVAGLPFFVRPSVGDPCKANLVDVMNKMGQYVPGLSSEPS
jgi:hypothetical protein